MAVRGAGRDAILSGFARRLPNDAATEIETAIDEIVKIGRLRLADMVEG
jgi:2-oxo-4-hydroxy-4-carboxy--5-ureidoimidazoline (OHCU) decarboxylase